MSPVNKVALESLQCWSHTWKEELLRGQMSHKPLKKSRRVYIYKVKPWKKQRWPHQIRFEGGSSKFSAQMNTISTLFKGLLSLACHSEHRPLEHRQRSADGVHPGLMDSGSPRCTLVCTARTMVLNEYWIDSAGSRRFNFFLLLHTARRPQCVKSRLFNTIDSHLSFVPRLWVKCLFAESIMRSS